MTKVAGKRFPFSGLLNTRELGGYPVFYEGKQKKVKNSLLYRSGSPENATTEDLELLETFKIKTIADFRSEIEKKSSFKMSTIEKNHELPIDAGKLMGITFQDGEWGANPTAQGAEEEMFRLYTLLPEEAIPKYRELFTLLADPANTPVIIQCSMGKDRTGLASALILHALGANKETIMEDYLESKENLRPYWERNLPDNPQLIPYFIVTEKYLTTAFTTIDKYGSIDNYLTTQLGADIEKLRELYTE